jgi:hypothetical protein
LETKKVFRQYDKGNIEESPKKISVRELLKPFFIFAILPLFFLLGSCVAIIPVGGSGMHGNPHFQEKHVHNPHGPIKGHGHGKDEHRR